MSARICDSTLSWRGSLGQPSAKHSMCSTFQMVERLSLAGPAAWLQEKEEQLADCRDGVSKDGFAEKD